MWTLNGSFHIHSQNNKSIPIWWRGSHIKKKCLKEEMPGIWGYIKTVWLECFIQCLVHGLFKSFGKFWMSKYGLVLTLDSFSPNILKDILKNTSSRIRQKFMVCPDVPNICFSASFMSILKSSSMILASHAFF